MHTPAPRGNTDRHAYHEDRRYSHRDKPGMIAPASRAESFTHRAGLYHLWYACVCFSCEALACHQRHLRCKTPACVRTYVRTHRRLKTRGLRLEASSTRSGARPRSTHGQVQASAHGLASCEKNEGRLLGPSPLAISPCKTRLCSARPKRQPPCSPEKQRRRLLRRPPRT